MNVSYLKIIFTACCVWGVSLFAHAFDTKSNDKGKEREYVDLGLPSGKLWAKCNIGANSVEEYGTYFDWEVNPVKEQWDEIWRTPTKEERDELLSCCTYSLDVVNGVQGARYTGLNGNSIFFPFAGYFQNNYGPFKVGEGGQYWTVTPNVDETHWVLAANKNPNVDDYAYYWPNPYFSFPVRAICDKTECPKGCVDLGLSSGTLWASCNVDAEQPEQYGGYYSWGELEEKDAYTRSNYKYGNVDLGQCISATQYDVAYIKSNGKLCMPSRDQFHELLDECTWTRGKKNGVEGYYAEGPNGNRLFFPLSGGKGEFGNHYMCERGYYWTGSNVNKSCAVRFDLNPSEIYFYNGEKFDGRPIRPVCVRKTPTSITTILREVKSVDTIFRPDGTRSQSLRKGLNIIRKSNGSCYKIIAPYK